MGVVFGVTEMLLRWLASCEFDVTKSTAPNPFRRAYLRFMRVGHGNDVAIGSQLYIRNRGALVLGQRCGIGSFARIWNYAPIHIGDDFLAAGNLTINSATHDPVNLSPVGEPIVIGDRVWCGVNVTILCGVTIGNDVVIAAGSVVTDDVPSNCIAGGVPARKLKELRRDEKAELWSWAASSR